MLGVDVGTTHCKAVVCEEDGMPLAAARLDTPVARDAAGRPFHDPEALWQAVVGVIRELGPESSPAGIRAVGVTGMAEAGLLVDAHSGEPASEIIPWYDPRSAPQVARILEVESPAQLFRRSGLRPSFKYGLAKLLWLRARDCPATEGAIWLSVPDFIVFRLTGCAATDPTLAARTYLYSLETGGWDEPWLERFGLSSAHLPRVLPSGVPAGEVHGAAETETGLTGAPVAAVAGHDHICAALAAGLEAPGTVVDSIGTAESMLGVLPTLQTGDDAFRSGLAIVPHVLPDRFCWLGGTRSAGRSLRWIGEIIGAAELPDETVEALLAAAGDGPTGVLFFPYLQGSGGTSPDENMRGALLGLDASHTRAHLFKAVIEGIAYESETIRRAAENLGGAPIEELIVVGGGAQHQQSLQIKADVTGCRCVLPRLGEAAALGAALLAGCGAGFITQDEVVALGRRHAREGTTIRPDAARQEQYRQRFETGYRPVGNALRAVSGTGAGEFD